MNARERILQAVGANKPAPRPLPVPDTELVIRYEDPLSTFRAIVDSIGGASVILDDFQLLKEEILTYRANGSFVINRIAAAGPVDADIAGLTAQELESLDVAYIEGKVAVAENGAIWIPESSLGNRLVPFICTQLVVLIDRNDIVATLHHAYALVDTAAEGFGMFLAGPSKTADIEQSLVIGAHGAKGLVVYIH